MNLFFLVYVAVSVKKFLKPVVLKEEDEEVRLQEAFKEFVKKTAFVAFSVFDNEILKKATTSTGIFFCISMYFWLMIAMIFFGLHEDFDISSEFLAAGYALYTSKATSLIEQILGGILFILIGLIRPFVLYKDVKKKEEQTEKKQYRRRSGEHKLVKIQKRMSRCGHPYQVIR